MIRPALRTERKRKKPHSRIRDKTDPAAREDYERMAAGAIEALAGGYLNMFLTFPWFVKMDKTFPRGICVARSMTTNTYKAKARKLLDWLHERGYSKVDSKTVIEARRNMLLKLAALDRQCNFVDNAESSNEETNEEDNDV